MPELGSIWAGFHWSPKRSEAAIELAQGKTRAAVALLVGVNERTIFKWMACPQFSAEVDRLSLMIGIASRAERLRIASRVIREKIRGDLVDTEKDVLEWLKFAQSETDGINLNLAASFLEAMAAMAEQRSGESGRDSEAEDRQLAS